MSAQHEIWSFFNPVNIRFGNGAVDLLPEALPPGRILAVTGRSATHGLLACITKILDGRDLVVFNEVEPNPSSQTIEKGRELFRTTGCSSVLGIGGGSPLDAAKAIAFLAKDDVPVLDIMHKRSSLTGNGVSFIAVPTTAGTGSEVTPFSIITDTETKKKLSIADPRSFPASAIIDPVLTHTMPPELTASTGLDALSHAVESAWSVRANSLTRTYAVEAVRLVFRNLEKAVRSGEDMQAREGMMLASMLAGIAISGTGTTINHSISYPLTLHRDVPHGFACALSLPVVMRYNLPQATQVMEQMAEAAGYSGTLTFIDGIERLMERVGAPRNLSEVGISGTDISWLTDESYGKNAAFNPRPVDKSGIEEILLDML